VGSEQCATIQHNTHHQRYGHDSGQSFIENAHTNKRYKQNKEIKKKKTKTTATVCYTRAARRFGGNRQNLASLPFYRI